MQKINQSIEINAPKEKVWDVLLEDKSYREWTTAFHEGSHFKGDWKEGSKILFLAPDGNGMVSKIKIHKPNEIVSIEHLGVVVDGKEIFDHPDFKEWSGLLETYRVEEKNGKTRLYIDQDMSEEHLKSFNEMWEKALRKVKEISERD